jgi:hypothetical protein
MYIVVDPFKGFLALEGPFAYPRWLATASGATHLSWVQANAYAQAYGGEVQVPG